ncbi:adaptor protein MecA [Lachnospiraceae bacterium 46-15]
MKIEKISDTQIRCTLTKEDLASRHLKLNELAYGTENAKSFFRDMMQQAAYEFGFEANDIPLMIEAIPLPSESIILIITKVEDPEELDTRFAKFAPSNASGVMDAEDSPIASHLEGADDILGLFNKIRAAQKKLAEKQDSKQELEEEAKIPLNLTRLYKFKDFDTVIHAAGVLNSIYTGHNSLYKNTFTKEYHLLISKSEHSPEEFNKICNILSEYGKGHKFAPGMDAFYSEHLECLVKENALQQLAQIS